VFGESESRFFAEGNFPPGVKTPLFSRFFGTAAELAEKAHETSELE
jgi:hypothetical protein